MASTSEIATRYFEALSAHDLDAAALCWQLGAIDRVVGSRDLIAPMAFEPTSAICSAPSRISRLR